MANPIPENPLRKEAEELIDLLAQDKKPTWPVRGEIMALAAELTIQLPKEKAEKIRAALKSLKEEVSTSVPKEVRSLFSWTQSELMQAAPDIANTIMEERFRSWKWRTLDTEEKTNIKIAIISRISEWEFATKILSRIEGWIASLTSGLKDIFKPGKIEELAKSMISGSKESSWFNSIETKITEEIMKMVDAWLWEIQKAHEMNPEPDGYKELLKHPKALAKYTYGADIMALIQSHGKSPNEKSEIATSIRSKLLKLDERVRGMEKWTESIFDILAKIPEIGSDKIIESLKWLFSIPIFWSFAKGFLWIKGNEDPIDLLKKETNERRSILSLKEYGLGWNKKWEIPVLAEIDFSGLNMRQLKGFMKKMRASSVDMREGNFWKKIFIDAKIIQDIEGNKKIIEFPKWEKWNETLSSIISKLNGQTLVPNEASQSIPTDTMKPTPNLPEETDRVSLLKNWLLQANSLPFRFGNETVNFSSWELVVWSSRYKLEWVGMLTVAIQSLNIKGDSIVLGHRFGTSLVLKSDVIDALPELLALKPWNVTEVKWDEGTLKITRSA